MSTMEDILANQQQLMGAMENILINFKKEPLERRTSVNIKKRIQTLDTYWEEFQANHLQLCEFERRDGNYFTENIYQKTMTYYQEARNTIDQYYTGETKKKDLSPANPSSSRESKNQESSVTRTPRDQSTLSRGNSSKLEELLRKQKSNFKAFSRTIANIDLESISEKWEAEDVMKNIQSRWTTIDNLHWDIDSESYEEDEEYEKTFSKYEQLFLSMKKSINNKMMSASHRENCTPKIEVPIFTGSYQKWTSFKDLFCETIHNNKSISSAQKLQFLKSKVKGEPERLIQHLNISSENYQVCWDILNHRYNNIKLIFSSHLNTLLSLPTMQQQSDTLIKNLFDTTNECLNAIKNLNVDITTWDPLIIHLLAQKLDTQTHSEYIESLEKPRELPSLTEFLKFLENKYTSLESARRKQSAPRSFSQSSGKDTSNYQHQHNRKPLQNQNKISTVFEKTKLESNKPYRHPVYKSYTTRTQASHICPLCKDNHGLFHCNTFLEANAETKLNTIEKHKLCKNCLYDHKDKTCFSEARCRVCNARHNTLLHDSYQQTLAGSSNKSSALPPTSQKQKTNVTHVSNNNISEILLATAIIKVKAENGSIYKMRALIDQGSQASLISENAAQLLNLPRRACKGVIFGVGTNQNNSRGVINITASSLYSDFTFNTDVFIMKNLINNLPNQTFSKPSWSYLQNIQLADPDFNISRPVDMLLGADVYSDIIMAGIIKEHESQPVAQQTHLGWILCGNVKSYQCNVVLNNIDDIQRFWAMEEISENITNMSTEDDICIKQFKSETFRREDGRYVVRLPLKSDIEEKIGDSKKRAVAQFFQLENKFAKNRKIAQDYKSFISEYIQLGHMRECVYKELPDCILPHLCVLRADSLTTALRVVFNASAKTSTGYSLNELMYSGPNLQHDLFTLILRWRKYKYVFTADIEKMFRQILCNEKDQKYQKIVWRENPNDVLREYQLTTVTYGTKSAPFLAMMTLKQLAEDERSKYPTAAKVLEDQFYMDDVLSGHHDLNSAIQLKTDLINLLKSGGFNLRKWSSNKPELSDDVISKHQQTFEFRHSESTKTLGLRWHPQKDQFTFQIKIDLKSSKPATKRSLLSDISKIFDPLGWLAPITTKLKLLFQSVWSLNLQWDEQVPENINKEWQKLKTDLSLIEDITIPRWLETSEYGDIELHGFCDSSSKAYACVIYCKINEKSNIKNQSRNSRITIVAAKSKLVPINKTITLPRLELSAALLLSKLMKVIVNGLSIRDVKIFCWSDSTAVLGWLQGDSSRWKPFVANRVKQIIEIAPADKWNYVKSAENPADSASRGILIEKLKSHPLWWQGPKWLSTFEENKIDKQKSIFSTKEEIKKSLDINVVTQCEDIVIKLLINSSNINRVTHLLAWLMRPFSRNQHKPSYLTINELRKASNIIIKKVQNIEFKEEIISLQKHQKINIKSNLIKLNPFIDQDGLMRVGGRLNNASMNQNMRHPLIIPNNTHIANLLIEQGHQMTLHGGARLTLTWLRQKYWIVGGMRAVKKQLRKCVTCKRHSPIKQEQLMGDLPSARTNPTRPFYHTGVDFTGFVDVKTNKGRGVRTTKGYIAVFVCMATKAVHLELVSDLSSSAFLAALRRMAARRGTPSHIYSDNGTNFVGASSILNKEFINLQKTLDDQFFKEITSMEIQWHFNAPSWPSAGGLWEAAVKSLKYHLKRVIGEQKLTFEEYTTLLTQIEACLNTRPLCALSEDPEDLDCLTPSHFLASGPTLTIIETERDLRTRWQLTQKIFDDVWKRWRAEYLCQLSARSKWLHPKANLQINDVVIIHDVNLPPGKWPLARIVELHPGRDGYVRVVSLKTKNGILKRPITKISPLLEHQSDKNSPISTQREDTPTTSQSNVTISKVVTHASSNTAPRVNYSSARKFNWMSMLSIILLLFMNVISSTEGTINVTQFRENQHLYFDKISDMIMVRDEWKIVVYYDMQPYWQGTKVLENYLQSLKTTCDTIKQHAHCDTILLQLHHGFTELEYYDTLLLGQQKRVRPARRRKRGLINGLGYVANSLFGVLDERFAEQYKKDIALVRKNEQHMVSLWKNQTTIIEAEYNLLKRTEAAINQQHKSINQHMNLLDQACNKLKSEAQVNHLVSSFNTGAIIANNLLSNLKNIQTTLLDTMTDIYHGRFNFHLLSPEQLITELSTISTKLNKDVLLPVDNIHTELRKVYELLRVQTRMLDDMLIFELKLPLISRDTYEIMKIISIPQFNENQTLQVVPVSTYISINMKTDNYFMLTENDLQSCLIISDKYYCHIKKPEYQLKGDKSFCEEEGKECKLKKETCKNKWVETSNINTFIYFCCDMCQVKAICGDQVTAQQLTRAGLIHTGNDCVIKTAEFTILSTRQHMTQFKATPDVYLPYIAPINDVVNITIPKFTALNQSHQEELSEIGRKINEIKQVDPLAGSISYHDIHHYTMIYVLLGIAAIIGAILVIKSIQCRWRPIAAGRSIAADNVLPTPTPAPAIRFSALRRSRSKTRTSMSTPQETNSPSVHYATVAKRTTTEDTQEDRPSSSGAIMDRATSPVIRKHFS